ncbi:MAG: DUF5309 family protein [Muribaculaceae bacterium]
MAETMTVKTENGVAVLNGPLTTAVTNQNVPDLLKNELDNRVVKIRPMSTPIDQISRWGGTRKAGSMIVDFYSVDTKPIEAKVTNYVQGFGGENPVSTITVDSNIFQASETLLIPGVEATTRDGKKESLILYVTAAENKTLSVISVNNYNSSAGTNIVPEINEGEKIIRMGKAATELDVQTPQFEALPVKSQNYCQIFKAQVEQSVFQKLADKEVGWTFTDQEEVAIIDMRLGMEKNFLFGSKMRFREPGKQEDVLLTGGIWNQTNHEWKYTSGNFDNNSLVEMSRNAFTGNAGSSRKVLIGGSKFIEALHKLEIMRTINSGEVKTKWGIDFTEICTKFGTFYVVLSEIFDQCGHSEDAFVLDPEYLTKYSHVPFRTERLDLRSSGLRNTEAVIITEASCLVLRYPNSHMRIVAQ